MKITAELLASEPFRILAICSVVLVLKMVALGLYTGLVRWREKRYVNPEDARAFAKTDASVEEHPLVARALRAHRNDLENILPFLAVGLLYVLTGATPLGAKAYFITFTVARVFHSWCYLTGLQPWRTINYTIGLLCTVGMLTHVARAVL